MGQKSLWFMHELQPRDTSYNTGFAMRIMDRLDMKAMQAALNRIYARHPLLIAVFRLHCGVPVAMPAVDATPYFEHIMADGLTDDAVHSAILEKYRLPFDLMNGPAARCYVFTKHEAEHIFLFSVHHIIYDFGCKGLISKELINFYLEACGYPPARQLPRPRQFNEYVREEEGMLKSAQGARHKQFWQQELSHWPIMPSLAANKRQEASPAEKTRAIFFSTDKEVYQLLKKQAQKQNVTTFAWLLAVFQLLLHKYTGQQQVVLGVPVSNREKKDQDTLGYFVNLLPVAASMQGKTSFTEYLQATMMGFFRVLTHKHYPFAAITELSRTERDPDKNPLVQIAFNYVTEAESMDPSLQTAISYYSVPQETAFDITFDIEEYEQNGYVACTYRTELYDHAFMQSFCDRYCFYLQQTVNEPDISFDGFRWTMPGELAAMRTWNETGQTRPQPALITTVFSAIAAAHADKVAIVAADRTITYRDLEASANRLACLIRQRLPDPGGTVIGLMTGRNSNMVVGMLGILKAGAAYMPIDTDYPPARIRLMLEETGCALLVSETLITGTQQPAIVLEEGWDDIPGPAPIPPDIALNEDAAAYIMFTSGSGGIPKAVAVKHAGVVNLVMGNDCMRFSADSIFMLTSNYVFDGSTFEIFGALLNGGRLHILTTETMYTAAAFSTYIKHHNINAACLPTALFNRLVDHDPSFVAGFDHLLFGGEAASLPHVRKALPYCRKKGALINAYGPTECTTFVLCYPVMDLPEHWTSIPIGRPHANTKVYILDDMLQPQPVGVRGQLYVSGTGMSIGYLLQPELTAARFKPAPWDAEEILYATGDLACWLPDGNVCFLGRSDQQFKFRGYRIEPGEIEAALCRHEQVQAAIVHCHKEEDGGQALVAFIAIGRPPQQEGLARKLQNYLSQSLPLYMVPSRFYVLPEFPLNHSGKVNRKALYNLITSNVKQQYAAPHTSVQRILAAIWQQVLNKPAIGLHDNFFELGGHSLLAGRIIAEINARLQVEVPLSAIFREPTIDTLGRFIEARRRQSAVSAPVALVRADREQFRRKN